MTEKIDCHSPLAPPSADSSSVNLHWHGLSGSSSALALVNAVRATLHPTVAVVPTARDLDILENALKFFASNDSDLRITRFPAWECLPYDIFSPHPDIVSQRIELLSRLPVMSGEILILSVDNIIQRLPPVDHIRSKGFSVDVGQTLNRDAFRSQLLEYAYRHVGKVELPGEVAVRGGVIDVFPMGTELPIRIELFDDVIESLRYFDPISQRSVRKIDSLHVLPGSEIQIDQAGIQKFRQAFRRFASTDPKKNSVYQSLSVEHQPDGAEFYMPLFFENTSSLMDYFPESVNLFIYENCDVAVEKYWDQILDRYEIAKSKIDMEPLPPEMMYMSLSELQSAVSSFRCIAVQSSRHGEGVGFSTESPIEFDLNLRSANPYGDLVQFLTSSNRKTLIVVESPSYLSAIETAFEQNHLHSSQLESWNDFLENATDRICLTISNLYEGFDLPTDSICVIGNKEVSGYRIPTRTHKRRSETNLESVISSMEQLGIGEPVVHDRHGVGRYQGLVTREINGQDIEFLKIEYANDGNLYIPVHSLDVVSRYQSPDDGEVPLHSLGSKKWTRAVSKARQSAVDVAAELLEIQSLRDSKQGISFAVDDELYEEFVESFPYQETNDQIDAIDETVLDLKSKKPMDRVICGDVGFGKTEVAMRAAYIAAMNGFQVAVVAPTTILAQQHYNVFQDRFAATGITLGRLSRLQTQSETRKTIERVKNGACDITIGTHRLLQADIQFKNLGLVIIDEEHRFGVRQKERLKQMRSTVDVLTLTATPIPRTLNMALREIRDISIIATPPSDRLAVHTFWRETSDLVMREACLRELHRGGQIFFVYNKVEFIEGVARRLAKLVPEAKIGIAHGQMPKAQLERVMTDFFTQRFDTLVCTTIIENGIDIPTANTIIINQANNFGLAQLHQLRGRVGRSHHQAYAYLLVDSFKGLTNEAYLRLSTINKFSQLGVGYTIASYDLEIRGAGEILGEAQSGAINDVGYAMYSRFLKDAISASKHSDAEPSVDLSLFTPAAGDIELGASVILPENWIPDIQVRLATYKRIASAKNEQHLEQIRHEMRDRFGKLPTEAERLLQLTKLKIQAKLNGIQELRIGPRAGHVKFSNSVNIDPANLLILSKTYPGSVRFDNAEWAIHVKHNVAKVEDRFELAEFIVTGVRPNHDITEASAP